MRRTEQAQGLRLMKFEEVYARTTARLLSQAETAEVLGAPHASRSRACAIDALGSSPEVEA